MNERDMINVWLVTISAAFVYKWSYSFGLLCQLARRRHLLKFFFFSHTTSTWRKNYNKTTTKITKNTTLHTYLNSFPHHLNIIWVVI